MNELLMLSSLKMLEAIQIPERLTCDSFQIEIIA